nr:hypothetical protein [Prochlorothrix hollandica]
MIVISGLGTSTSGWGSGRWATVPGVVPGAVDREAAAGAAAVPPEPAASVNARPWAVRSVNSPVGAPVSPVTITRTLLESRDTTWIEAIPGAGFRDWNPPPSGSTNWELIISATQLEPRSTENTWGRSPGRDCFSSNSTLPDDSLTSTPVIWVAAAQAG